jgi:hypothetical protein
MTPSPGVVVFLVTFFFTTASARSAFPDWLVHKMKWPSVVQETGEELTLTNGLISKRFRTTPAFAAVDFYSHEKRSSLMRAIAPEVSQRKYAPNRFN